MGKAKFSKLGRKKSVKSVSKKCAKKTSVSSKAKKPKKPKPQPETDPFCEDEYRFGREFTTIKMGLKNMVVDDQFLENLNDVVVRASKVAILGSYNVYYEFKKAFDDNNFTKIERLAIKIQKKPECFFNGVRGRKTVNQDDCDEMAQKYFTQFDIALQPPDGMSQVIMYIAQQYRTNLMNFVQDFAMKRVIACLLIFFARRTIKRQPIDKESKKKVSNTVTYLFFSRSTVEVDMELLRFLQSVVRTEGNIGRGEWFDCWTKDDWPKYILPFMRIQRFIIDHNQSSNVHKFPEWNVFPIYSNQRKFITLDQLALVEVHNLNRMTKKNKISKVNDDSYTIFKKCFKLEQLRPTQQERFAFQASSDGVALDLLFYRHPGMYRPDEDQHPGMVSDSYPDSGPDTDSDFVRESDDTDWIAELRGLEEEVEEYNANPLQLNQLNLNDNGLPSILDDLFAEDEYGSF